ncbi:zinc ribbon domain-containing protein [Paenibacillus sp. J2TS4]|uniref:zinc ribbon domain-containing protein n=1 Tax=Paenibacillus sp. J2TS4 TaxID=2807194 RepID=UPI001B1826A2|nr:zinc ribbon domain-containing protein [Paenibacillus sp. J2TS4]GIP34523.1 hypothetical protein J2TS4_37330 [Paenibacillus sp. J2TS4]
MKSQHCQSCGMPMEEPQRAKEKDGTVNEEYCLYCYEEGQFKQPEITMEQMIDICVPFMKESGMPEEQARALLQQQLPTLSRWKAAEA